MKALKKIAAAVALVMTVGFAGTASATLFTFDFNSLANDANATSISNYMTGIFGAPVTVTGRAPTAEHSILGLLGPDTYIESEPITANHVITITFSQAITSVSFDWAAFADEFAADANGVNFFDTGYNLLPSRGHLNTYNFAAPVTTLSFHDSYVGEVGIDNLQVTTVPEPATMFLFGAGCLAVAAFSRRRRAIK